jgi:hypothetical protein
MTEPSRFLEHRTQTAILISEDDGKTFHEYARRFDDYWEAQAHAIDIQVITQKLLMMKLEMVETYYLKSFEDKFGMLHEPEHFDAGTPTPPKDPIVDHFDALKDFAETHPGAEVIFDGPSLFKGRRGSQNGRDIDDEISF